MYILNKFLSILVYIVKISSSSKACLRKKILEKMEELFLFIANQVHPENAEGTQSSIEIE